MNSQLDTITTNEQNTLIAFKTNIDVYVTTYKLYNKVNITAVKFFITKTNKSCDSEFYFIFNKTLN